MCSNQGQSCLHFGLPAIACGALHLTDISKLLSIAVKNHQVKGWDAGLMKCAGTVLEAPAQKGLF